MNTAATSESGYSTLPLSMLDESSTNPRRTFDPRKLVELAESIARHGLIQPITVRPKGERFEVVAGARRFRAAQIAELAEVPTRVLDLTDEQTLEVQIIENSQRENVHPYEEAAGYQRLLEMPGYDVAGLSSKCGKSASHVYARLSLLQLIPEIAEAFQQDRITASHANLLARLPEEHQQEAFKQCWRKDWQDKDAHLLPAKHLSAWIQENLYLPLAEAPFSTEDPLLNAEAGACVTCPRRSGFNTALFADVQGDQCLDAPCYQSKLSAHIDRELAASPALVQIETAWHNPQDRRPGAIPNNHWRQLPEPGNPDAEPPCEHTRPAIVVFGRHVGRKLAVCTDLNCPVHDPRQAQDRAAHPVPVMEAPQAEETAEEAQARKADYERRQAEYRAEQKKRAAAEREEQERQDAEYQAEQERREKLRKKREATFERIVKNAPAQFSAAQLRVVLRALVNLDPYTFADDLAAELSPDPDNDRRSAEEVLLTTIDGLTDDKLMGFDVHLALAGHRNIPREDECDLLSEAQAAFTPKSTHRLAKVQKTNKARVRTNGKKAA